MFLHLPPFFLSFFFVFFLSHIAWAEPLLKPHTAAHKPAQTEHLSVSESELDKMILPSSSACAVNFFVIPRNEWTKAEHKLEWDLMMLKTALKDFQATQNLGGTRDLVKWAGIGAAASTISAMTGHNAQNGEDLMSYYMRTDPLQAGAVLTASIAVTVLARAVYVKIRPGQTRRRLLRAVRKVDSSLDAVIVERQGALPAMVGYANELRNAAECALIEAALRNTPRTD